MEKNYFESDFIFLIFILLLHLHFTFINLVGALSNDRSSETNNRTTLCKCSDPSHFNL